MASTAAMKFFSFSSRPGVPRRMWSPATGVMVSYTGIVKPASSQASFCVRMADSYWSWPISSRSGPVTQPVTPISRQTFTRSGWY